MIRENLLLPSLSFDIQTKQNYVALQFESNSSGKDLSGSLFSSLKSYGTCNMGIKSKKL